MPKHLQYQYINLVQQHAGIIHKVIGLYVDDPEDKKDLYQEVLLQGWKSFGSFKGDAAFSTWLYKVCLNTVLTFKRREYKFKEAIAEAEPPTQTVKNENSELLYYLIKQLPEVDRMLMILHLDGYKNIEIAEITGTKQNYVNVKIHRLKNQLITQFKNKANGSF
ncbi:RNA polymerase sigma factor [Mucilaginibacter antarcticus]|uniref:RNA polymerase sigma factor n=1 Tax=Mucilaginibacter antarcticus TaxID=1855725 RepID=A0ABW5XQI4_9SPHI